MGELKHDSEVERLRKWQARASVPSDVVWWLAEIAIQLAIQNENLVIRVRLGSD